MISYEKWKALNETFGGPITLGLKSKKPIGGVVGSHGFEDMPSDDHEEPDSDDMGGESDMDSDDMGDETDMDMQKPMDSEEDDMGDEDMDSDDMGGEEDMDSDEDDMDSDSGEDDMGGEEDMDSGEDDMGGEEDMGMSKKPVFSFKKPMNKKPMPMAPMESVDEATMYKKKMSAMADKYKKKMSAVGKDEPKKMGASCKKMHAKKPMKKKMGASCKMDAGKKVLTDEKVNESHEAEWLSSVKNMLSFKSDEKKWDGISDNELAPEGYRQKSE